MGPPFNYDLLLSIGTHLPLNVNSSIKNWAIGRMTDLATTWRTFKVAQPSRLRDSAEEPTVDCILINAVENKKLVSSDIHKMTPGFDQSDDLHSCGPRPRPNSTGDKGTSQRYNLALYAPHRNITTTSLLVTGHRRQRTGLPVRRYPFTDNSEGQRPARCKHLHIGSLRLRWRLLSW